jgi:putative membrane protein
MIWLFAHMAAAPLTLTWLLIYLTGLLWSLANPHDYFTWILEAAPALIAFFLLAVTYKVFPLTPLAYTLVLVHCLILFLGAHYTCGSRYVQVHPRALWLAEKQLR